MAGEMKRKGKNVGDVPGLNKKYPTMHVRVEADGQFFGSISPSVSCNRRKNLPACSMLRPVDVLRCHSQ